MDDQVRADYEQLRKEGKEAKRLDKERLELLELLVRHPGWKVLRDLMNVRKQELSDAILAPEEDEFALIRNVGLKGEMRGILFYEQMLGRTIAGLKSQFESENEDVE